MIDLLFLAHNRLRFTQEALAALEANTNWSKVARLLIYDDGSNDGTREFLQDRSYVFRPEFRFGLWGSPVSVMNHYLCASSPHEERLFGKIDSDTMVPYGWLDECLSVMNEYRELKLLGIEAFCRIAAQVSRGRGYQPARHIGGIGIMRSDAFVTLPRPYGRFGFTAWQEQTPKAQKGWINPSLPVFLLDRLPREPWRALSKEYIAKGWQRAWSPYDETMRDLWSWWCA